MSLRRYAALALALGSGVAASGCGTDCPNCPGPPARVVISPGSPSVLTNDSIQLHAVVVDADGNLLAGHPVQWSSLDPAVAAVIDTSGRIRAGGTANTARIVATMSGLADTIQVAVVVTVTYSQQVYPILVTTCGLGGCHVTPGPAPTLNASASASYNQLLAGGTGWIVAGDSTVGELLTRLRASDPTNFPKMPPQQQLSTLAPGDYHLIAAWIAQGAVQGP
jgi:hypothetical protein